MPERNGLADAAVAAPAATSDTEGAAAAGPGGFDRLDPHSRAQAVLALQRASGNGIVQRAVQGGALLQRQPPGAAAVADAPAGPAMTAADILAAHHRGRASTGIHLGNAYDAAAIGTDLAGRPAGQEALQVATLRAALTTGCDPKDLVRPFTQAQLDAIAVDPVGERMLLDLVERIDPEALGSGYLLEGTRVEVRMLYRAIAAAENSRSGTIAVEVLTFAHGVGALDTLGQNVFRGGVRGHTALVVGSLVYSFDERGWAPEGTKDEYLGRQQRDGVGQTIDVPRAEAERIQNWLIGQIGTGVYLFGGDVCVDSAALALRRAIGSFNAHHSPQQFRWQLEASGHVTATHEYANPHAPAGHVPTTDAEDKLAAVRVLFAGYVSDRDIEAVEQAYNGNAGDRPTLKPEIERAIPTLHNAGQQVRLCRLVQASVATKVIVLQHLFATWVTDENIHDAQAVVDIEPADRAALLHTIDEGIRSLNGLGQTVAATLALHPSSGVKASVIRQLLAGYVTDDNIAKVGEIYRLDPADQGALRPVIQEGIDSLHFDRQKALLRNIISPE